MPIRRFIEVFKCHPANALPDDVLSCLTGAERGTFADVHGAFQGLADRCALPSLRKLLQECAEGQFGGLELNAYDGAPMRGYFRFILNELSPAIRLPDEALDMHSWPPCLQSVYASIGGIQEQEFGLAGALWPGASVSPIRIKRWVKPPQVMEPAKCPMFLDTYGGDQYGFHEESGAAVMWNHESFKLEEAGPLEGFLDRYFRGLLAGDRL